MEPRARPRQKGQLFSTSDLTELLFAFGSNGTALPNSREIDPATQLPVTVTVLDEILTDFIIETCHQAALCASYSRRAKIKVDDFKWVLRKDEKLLGRVLEQLWKEKAMKNERKVVDFDSVGKENVGDLEGLAEVGGAQSDMVEGKGKGRGRGKKGVKKKRKADDEAGGDAKRVAS